MNKKISLILTIILVLTLLSTFFLGCNDKDKSMHISYEEVSLDTLNSTFLENYNENKMCLVKDHITNFIIATPNEMDKGLSRAVNELKSVLEEMSNATFTVLNISNIDDYNKNIIYIDTASQLDTEGIIEDGFKLSIKDTSITIKGSDSKGSKNGIYTFIEDYLGAMFLTENDTFIPKHKNIYLEKVEKTINPAIAWRDIYSYETALGDLASKLKLNGIDDISSDEEILASRKGVTEENKYLHLIEGRQYTGWGSWCHNCYSYLSPDDYFESHPEYFSLKDGKRVHTYKDIGAHLCLSNPEVYDIVEKSLEEKIKANPNDMYWDFSGNDNWAVYGCECENCKKLDKAAGGTGMGSLAPFLNKLAKKFPDKYISSLAYNQTINPPKNIEFEDNIVIKLCSMPGDQASSYLNPTNHNAKVFHDQLVDWAKVCNKIVVWDYVVNFANLLLPFPNFAVQQENQKFYEDNNIQGVFHQGSREKGGELTYLKNYVLSKLMWEGSTMSVENVVSKYVAAYYGSASTKVIEYLNLLADNLAKSSSTLGLYDRLAPHVDGYLSKDNIEKYESILNEAKELVIDDDVLAKRVDDLLMNVNFAKISNPKVDKNTRLETKDIFNAQAKAHNVTMTAEWESMSQFNENYNNMIKAQTNEINKPIYITLGVIGGVTVLSAIIFFIIKIIKKHRAKQK